MPVVFFCHDFRPFSLPDLQHQGKVREEESFPLHFELPGTTADSSDSGFSTDAIPPHTYTLNLANTFRWHSGKTFNHCASLRTWLNFNLLDCCFLLFSRSLFYASYLALAPCTTLYIVDILGFHKLALDSSWRKQKAGNIALRKRDRLPPKTDRSGIDSIRCTVHARFHGFSARFSSLLFALPETAMRTKFFTMSVFLCY